jgi:ketosteroid isomerase-like protein
MSQENVKKVRASQEAYSRGDFDAALANFDPDVEWYVAADLLPDPATYRGHEGTRAFWQTFAETFEGFQLQIEECRALSPAQVLVTNRAHGTGAGSGVEVSSANFFQLVDFRDGKVIRVRMYANEEAALEAAGLRE